MFFTSTFQFHQSIFFDTLQYSSFSLRFPNLHRLHSSFSSFNFKQCPLQSSPTTNPKKTWIKSWREEESRFLLLPKRPRAAIDYREYLSSDDDAFGNSASTGSTTMSKIVEKLKRFGYMDGVKETREQPSLPEKGSVEDIFYDEDGMIPDSRGGLSLDLREEVRFPWEKNRIGMDGDLMRRKRSKSMLAELTLPQGEIRRLRHLGIRVKSKIRVRGAGVTHEIVDAIREKWQTEEVVRVKCEGAPALNMKRMHEILEVLFLFFV